MSARRPAPAVITACAVVLALTATACSSGFDKSSSGPEQDTAKQQKLRVLIASSGPAETEAVKKATAAFEKKSGHQVTVQLAKDIDQELGQAFAGSTPPDAFYINSDQFANYAQGGSLYPYGDKIPDAGDFNPQLRQAFTYEDKLTCLPKDSSTLGLVVNTQKWEDAGLTEKDYPKTWDDLEKVADRLTEGKTAGLTVTPEHQRLGAFMKQAGGWFTDKNEKKMTADTKQNAEGLAFARKLLRSGSMQYAKELGAGWSGEAFGKGRAAMTIEGNWIAGALKKDFPDVKYKVLPLPAGPAGEATLAFSNCWGVAKQSKHHAAAVQLIRHLTSKKEQLASSDAVGLLPSRSSVLKQFTEEHPETDAWADGIAHSQSPVTIPGFNKVLDQFNADLQSLPSKSPESILKDLQRNGEQAIKKGD